MKKNLQNKSNNTFTLANASGPVIYNLTNDYLFHAVFQNNSKALKGLLCSLLHLKPEDITSIAVTSPIDVGRHILEKELILDIKAILNNNTTINLEMQVKDEHNWPERSLVYTCRTFSSLNHGEDYSKIKSVIHVGFVNFDLFPNQTEFYATYKLFNVKNHAKYSDKFTLSVVNLNRADIATDEDRAYDLDSWARFFKSTRWEEIRMLAEKNPGIKEAAETIITYTCDDAERYWCEMREEYLRRARTEEIYVKRKLAEMELTKEELNNIKSELNDAKFELNDAKSELNDAKSELNDAKSKLNNANNKLSAYELENARLRAELEALKQK